VAYDEDLANRIRELILTEPGVTEKKMFGGLAFMINGNMAVSASGQGGLLLHVEQIEIRGRVPTQIRAWANLHFLREGSPFSVTEADLQLFVAPDVPHPIGEELRRRLRQVVDFEFASLRPVVHPGVTTDRWGYATSVPADINERDQLGRTALWRAAFRGYAEQVLELLEAGADAGIPRTRR